MLTSIAASPSLMRDIHTIDILPTSEDDPRNTTESTTVAMFLEEWSGWSEIHDPNRPSSRVEGAESGAHDDCRMSMSPSSPYLGRSGSDFEQLHSRSTSPNPVVVPNKGTAPQIGHRSPHKPPIPDLVYRRRRDGLQGEPAPPKPPFLDQLEVRLI